MMRSLSSIVAGSALLALAPLCVAPQATAADDLPGLREAFNYNSPPTTADAATGVESVSYLTDCCSDPSCCCEPSCEAPCGCGDCGDACGCGDECGCGDGCGCACGATKKAKPTCAGSHSLLFYANDFSYLKDPCYNGCCLGDCMKLMDTPCGTVDIGGQFRFRYHHEEGMGRTVGANSFEDTEQDFLLSRLRLYTNWKINDWSRFYVEGILADNAHDDSYIPRPIDRNWGDIQNLFFDVNVTDNSTFRIGRQEISLGAQRFVSPLDWANTRRTFEGLRLLSQYEDWTVDTFYLNVVPVTVDQFDEADYDQSFYGVYGSYAGSPNTNVDVFYFGYDNENPGTTAGSDFSLHTFGGRIYGGAGSWLWDMEGAYQTGRQSGLGRDHSAGMCTVGAGRKLDCPWSPTLWCYFDYASGDDGTGQYSGFNQLFPLVHKYLGFADVVARSNVMSPNCLLTMKPSKKVNLLFWYYYFQADVAGSVVPGIAVPPNQNANSDDLGQELDMILKYQISPRSDILFGYSHFWRGDKINGNNDIDFFYTQWQLNF